MNSFTEEYGNFGVKKPDMLGAYPATSVPGILSDLASAPVNPQSFIDGQVTNILNFLGQQVGVTTDLREFRLVIMFNGLQVFKSNGIDPNGILDDTVINLNIGDICIGADAGKLYYFSSSPSNWTAL